jgi:DNA-nicking Smr family endonuclease
VAINRLADAVAAYERARVDEVETVERIKQQARADTAAARAKVDQARDVLAEAIVAAARSGVRQVEIVRVTGYTRESVRRIVRAAE